MNDITIMESPKFGQVRKVLVDGEWMYVASDVAKALGYAKPENAIPRHCRCTLKRGIPHPQNPDKEIQMTLIPKGDVLRLISQSHLPAAQEFNHWLFDDVAVQVVDNGMYLSPEKMRSFLNDPAAIIAICQNWQADKERLAVAEEKIEQDAPKVLLADAVAASKTDISVGDMAKILRQNGYNTGRDRFFAQLREEGYLIRDGRSQNVPTQRSIEMGIMRVKETTFQSGDEQPVVRKTPLITGKGQAYFTKRYLGM